MERFSGKIKKGAKTAICATAGLYLLGADAKAQEEWNCFYKQKDNRVIKRNSENAFYISEEKLFDIINEAYNYLLEGDEKACFEALDTHIDVFRDLKYCFYMALKRGYTPKYKIYILIAMFASKYPRDHSKSKIIYEECMEKAIKDFEKEIQEEKKWDPSCYPEKYFESKINKFHFLINSITRNF